MSFSKDFLWGAASAAFQIEGAAEADGKGPSIWDALVDGHVVHGETGKVSCDHYHHYKEDIALMKSLGLKAYRFSVSWPRIVPEEGKVNEKGLQFYKDLVNELADAGIRPLCTLYHWDLPMWMHEKGGWYSDEVSGRFAEYAGIVVDALSDKVSDWMTLNEPTSFIGAGYMTAEHAPFETIDMDTDEGVQKFLTLTRNVLLGHAKAAAAIREHAKTAPKISIATDSALYMPESESSEDIEAARSLTFGSGVNRYYLNWWLDPIMKGEFNPAISAMFSESEKALIHQPLDFVGWNCYMSHDFNEGPDGKSRFYAQGMPRTNMGWPVTPDALYWGSRFITERYGVPVMITENGMANVDFIMDDGCVHDPQRIQYLKWYLRGLKRAAGEGCPVIGYMVWSILDNMEWALGYDKRFGIIFTDYATGKRIPKDSAYWYSEVIKTNGENL